MNERLDFDQQLIESEQSATHDPLRNIDMWLVEYTPMQITGEILGEKYDPEKNTNLVVVRTPDGTLVKTYRSQVTATN